MLKSFGRRGIGLPARGERGRLVRLFSTPPILPLVAHRDYPEVSV